MNESQYQQTRERLYHLVDDLRRLRGEVTNPDLQNFLTAQCNQRTIDHPLRMPTIKNASIVARMVVEHYESNT